MSNSRYYNATILSNLLSYKEKTGNIQDAEMLNQISPIAWQHINLHGRYEFRKQQKHININAIIQELANVPIKQKPNG